MTLEDSDCTLILETLEQAGWVAGGPLCAAAKLGLKRTSLLAKMRRLVSRGLSLRKETTFPESRKTMARFEDRTGSPTRNKVRRQPARTLEQREAMTGQFSRVPSATVNFASQMSS
jgi:hypothetical protein